MNIQKLVRHQLITIQISLGQYSDFVTAIINNAEMSSSSYVCVANVHMLVEAHNDPDFAEVVNNSEIITPDGNPLTWALKFLYGISQPRVAGMDLLPSLLDEASKKSIPIYFYGGTTSMLNSTLEYVAHFYPNLNIAGVYSPPFRPLTSIEESFVIDNINNSKAKIVFVALGCPKQEKWMASMKGRVQATMIGIGGALPVMIGLQKRAPIWMQKSSLEWFYRLLQEPKRLFKRYAITNSIFLWLLLKAKILHSNS